MVDDDGHIHLLLVFINLVDTGGECDTGVHHRSDNLGVLLADIANLPIQGHDLDGVFVILIVRFTYQHDDVLFVDMAEDVLTGRPVRIVESHSDNL